MSSRTTNLQLLKLDRGDNLDTESGAFLRDNLDVIDQAVNAFGPGHKHNGIGATPPNVSAPATLTITADPGTFPSTTTVYYKYSFKNAAGGETEAAPLASISTSGLVSKPTSGPTLTASSTGGTMPPGSFEYLLSAYQGAVTLETEASPSIQIYVQGTGSTNSITLAFPGLPSGADGFNIYRRAPGELQFLYLDSQAEVAGVVADYVDDWSVAPNCNRASPTQNTTSQAESIKITLPIPVPAGYVARIFRTFNTSDWGESLLATIAVEGEDEFLDSGSSTIEGAPRAQGQILGSPSKIDLTNMNEVQGKLPPVAVSYPSQAYFLLEGAVTTGMNRYRHHILQANAKLKNLQLNLDFLEFNGVARINDVEVKLWKGSGEIFSTATMTEITPGTPKFLEPGDTSASYSLADAPVTAGEFLAVEVTGTDTNAFDLEATVTMWLFPTETSTP